MDCEENNKISVSCLDLTYSITYKITTKIKDESQDVTNTIALLDIPENELVDEQESEDYCKHGTVQSVSSCLLLVIIIVHEKEYFFSL